MIKRRGMCIGKINLRNSLIFVLYGLFKIDLLLKYSDLIFSSSFLEPTH